MDSMQLSGRRGSWREKWFNLFSFLNLCKQCDGKFTSKNKYDSYLRVLCECACVVVFARDLCSSCLRCRFPNHVSTVRHLFLQQTKYLSISVFFFKF